MDEIPPLPPSLSAAFMSPSPPDALSEYIKILGKGAFGTVHLIRKRADVSGEWVRIVIKEVPLNSAAGTDSTANDDKCSAFNHEAVMLRMVAQINGDGKVDGSLICPRIVGLFKRQSVLSDPTSTPRSLMLAMEYLDGYATLGDVLDHPRSMDKFHEKSRPIAATQLIKKLVSLHAHGIIHSDIKPDNIMVNPDTGDVVFIDFGTAFCIKAGAQQGKFTSLTEAYAKAALIGYAKNILRGEPPHSLSIESDWFALFLVVYYLFTNECAFFAWQRLAAPLEAYATQKLAPMMTDDDGRQTCDVHLFATVGPPISRGHLNLFDNILRGATGVDDDGWERRMGVLLMLCTYYVHLEADDDD